VTAIATPALRIVVADDHDLYRAAVARTIGGCDAMQLVAAAPDGHAALAAIRTHAPDVAVIDVHMPGLTGLEVLAAVVADVLPTRVLLLSAELAPATARAAIDAGAAGCLQKDIDAAALCDAIRVAGLGIAGARSPVGGLDDSDSTTQIIRSDDPPPDRALR
jgi:two-component system nitrate/nitrite response regulator NarL